MTTAFWVTYSLLALVIVTENAVALRLAKDVATMRRPRKTVRDGPRTEVLAPAIVARRLGECTQFDSSAYAGKDYILLFLDPRDSGTAPYWHLKVSVAGLFKKVDGRLCIVCSGSEESCTSMFEQHGLGASVGSPLEIVLDADAELSQKCDIGSTPVALMVDARGVIWRVGKPLPSTSAPPS